MMERWLGAGGVFAHLRTNSPNDFELCLVVVDFSCDWRSSLLPAALLDCMGREDILMLSRLRRRMD